MGSSRGEKRGGVKNHMLNSGGDLRRDDLELIGGDRGGASLQRFGEEAAERLHPLTQHRQVVERNKRIGGGGGRRRVIGRVPTRGGHYFLVKEVQFRCELGKFGLELG